MTLTPTRRVLAIDIGGTKINAAVVTAEGAGSAPAVLGPVRTVRTPAAAGAAAVVDAAVTVGREAVAATGAAGIDGAGLDGVGIASAGVIDTERGVVVAATDSLPGWVGTDLVAAFEDAFGVHASALNDVHAHGLGEAISGSGKDHDSVLLVAVGTGIGGAFVEDGRVHTGAVGAAGHIGHLPAPEAAGVPCPCGRTGHLEGFASGPGILATLQRRGGEAADTAALAAAAAAGDELATAVLRDAGFATGRVIGGLLNVLDPGVVAITGGVSAAGELWWDEVRRGVRHDAMDAVAATALVPAASGNHAALLGAAHHFSTTMRTTRTQS